MRRVIWIGVVACVGTLSAAAPLFADNGEAPPPATSASEKTIERVTPSGEGKGLDTRLSVTMREMDLGQAVRLLADEAGVNVALGKDVQGTATCSLKNVTVRNALYSLLYANGYGMIEKDEVLVVISLKQQAELEKEVVEVKIVRKSFSLPYTGKEKDFVASSGSVSGPGVGAAPAAAASGGRGGEELTVEKTIRSMLSPKGKMAYYERQHLVIVQDTEDVVKTIEEFVAALWAVPIQVYIDSKLVELTLEKGEALGINWTIFQKIGKSGKGLHPNSASGITHPGTSIVSTATSNASIPNTVPFTFGIVNANIEATVQALQERERVDLHSNPRVLVMNHRTATIIVGQEIPYLSSTESGTTNPVNTFEFKEVAVRLEVTPHVSEDGSVIFMDIHPQVKNLIGFQGEPPQPVLSTREAVTYVAVGDNETLILGGLVQRNINKTRWRTPFLSRIPLIGLLFRQKQDSDTKNDLIFLLNPRILRPEVMDELKRKKAGILQELPKHPGESEPGKPKW